MARMMIRLNAAQRRVLGVLVEKSRTTPGGYPLTLNALTLGCNQLSCREPVMTLAEDEVARAVRELGSMGLAAEADPGRGARVERYRHAIDESLKWDLPRQALVAELLLRGPQTAGELKTNASRMAPLPELEAILRLLREMAAQDPPLVVELPRQPGKSVARFDHLLYAEERAAAPATAPSGLEARVAKLESELTALREEVEGLRRDHPK
jgi:uncharacterized protein YceH (UPF0502 family)